MGNLEKKRDLDKAHESEDAEIVEIPVGDNKSTPKDSDPETAPDVFKTPEPSMKRSEKKKRPKRKRKNKPKKLNGRKKKTEKKPKSKRKKSVKRPKGRLKKLKKRPKGKKKRP